MGLNWRNIISSDGKNVSKGKLFSVLFLIVILLGEIYAIVAYKKFLDIPEGLLVLLMSLLGYNGFKKFLFYKYTGGPKNENNKTV